MMIGEIELTPHEKELVDSIEFNQELVFRHGLGQKNSAMAYQLMKSLIARKAIPENREKYFVDPEFHPGGRGRSRMGIFEKNGTCGDDIFRHGNFLNYIRYFIFGADLPKKLIDEFAAKVDSCGNVTSGDIEPLRKHARELTRRYQLRPYDASSEFFKLSIDCELRPYYAKSIEDAVRQVR